MSFFFRENMKFDLDTFQIVLVVFISILIANYLYLKLLVYSKKESGIDLDGLEGFSDMKDGDQKEALAILGNDHIFDDFYAQVYDQLVDGKVRTKAEVTYSLNWIKSYRPELKSIEVLDIGCGTGHAVDEFKKAGVGKAVGIDRSDAMIEKGKKLFPKLDLRVGDTEIIGTCSPNEFNVATMYYFTFYYLKDRDGALRNIYNWLQMGSCLIIHLVNREKFDPILESASPFVAFSMQKYAKDRITNSKVAFDKFDYVANFEAEGSDAQFKEEFKFKDGKTRRQIHRLRMPTMDETVAIVERAGFTYKQFIDLTPIGYEYQYLFCFVK
jgi:ubiquinone/menaquinone biosynthesis C-methylase UbiE